MAFRKGVEGHAEMSEGNYVVIKFLDTGEGIKPEHLPHIFEPFFTTKTGRGSWDLTGLWNCQGSQWPC